MSNNTFLENFFNEYVSNNKYKEIFEEVYDYFGDKLTISFLSKIMKNELLTKYIFSSISKKYLYIGEALENNVSNNSILLYCEELGLYIIFDNISNCVLLFNNLCNSDTKIEFLYQIVPIDSRQKVVFSIGGSIEDKERIKRYIENYYKCDLYVVKNGKEEEITIIMNLVENYVESVKVVNKLYEFISKKDTNLAKNIIKSYIYYAHNYNYTMNLLYFNESYTFDNKKLEINDIIKNSNFVIPIKNNKIINMTKTEEKRILAIEWIQNNPPIDKEKKQDYFNRFCENTNKKIRQGVFNSCVESLVDVKEVRINDIRRWDYIK
jgi:hypothetical protein